MSKQPNMKFTVLLIFMQLLTLIIWADTNKKSVSFDESDKRFIRYLYPGFQEKTNVVGEQEYRHLISCEVRKWEYLKNTYVILVLTANTRNAHFYDFTDNGEERDIPGKMNLFVVQETGSTLSTIASCHEDFLFFFKEDSVPMHFIKLDLAPYKVTDSDCAIGVRMASTYQVRYNENLSLYLIEKEGLRKIFDHYIKYTDRFREYESLLIITKNKTGDYYNILRKTTSTSLIEDSPNPPETETNLFTWAPELKHYRF